MVHSRAYPSARILRLLHVNYDDEKATILVCSQQANRMAERNKTADRPRRGMSNQPLLSRLQSKPRLQVVQLCHIRNYLSRLLSVGCRKRAKLFDHSVPPSLAWIELDPSTEEHVVYRILRTLRRNIDANFDNHSFW
jgi:hypothetical protein